MILFCIENAVASRDMICVDFVLEPLAEVMCFAIGKYDLLCEFYTIALHMVMAPRDS